MVLLVLVMVLLVLVMVLLVLVMVLLVLVLVFVLLLPLLFQMLLHLRECVWLRCSLLMDRCRKCRCKRRRVH